MVQESREYRINENGNKGKYLKYFSADWDKENQAGEEGSPESNKKTCIYCGSTRVPQYGQGGIEVCENCYAQLLGSRQEFSGVLYRTKANLEQLMGVFVPQSVSVVYKNGWLSQHKRYFGKGVEDNFEKKGKDAFIKNLVTVSKSKKAIEFTVHEKMPRSTFMYLIAENIIAALLEGKIVKLAGSMTYHPMKCAAMKWCALRYMYLSGYTDFCQNKNQEELKDTEYGELVEKMGFPLKGSKKSMDEIVHFLKEQIAMMEKGEGQKESGEGEETDQPQEGGRVENNG